jgi:RNA recognition motif-containing protein
MCVDYPVMYTLSIHNSLVGVKMNIYVGSLSYDATEDEVRDVFSPYGEISSISIITDKYSGKSKGFGFVEMPKQEEAEEAIKCLDESEMKGRNIKVNEARPKEERPKRRERY